MKKIALIALSMFFVVHAIAQSQGINYQAVIISSTNQEIPGNDISGNIIPNKDIMVRFSILDVSGSIQYQEEHATKTDAYGMINLIIGKGTVTASSPFIFTEIDWNGSSKNLKVDISLSQTTQFYTDFSYQELNFVPYAYHKNITATGTLVVDSKSTLQDLEVQASTNLNGFLSVNYAKPTYLSGNLTVQQTTTLNNELTVNAISRLNDHVAIDGTKANGAQADFDTYPLNVKGNTQGISIKMAGTRNSETNFVTFFDTEGPQGRIEGETKNEVFEDPTWYFTNAGYVVELGIAIKDVVAILSSSAPCVGLGVCITTPSVSMTIAAFARLVIRIVNIVVYNTFRFEHAGVVFKTYGSDYAEYLPKANLGDVFYPGDIVGIKGGFITKSTNDADIVMVISSQPIVLGNMPKAGKEQNYEKVAFIGQVPTKVGGIVNAGDFILPSGKNDGGGIAVSPENIKPEQYLKIVGVAWPNTDSTPFGYTNIAVGLNTHDVSRLSMKQELQINALLSKVDSLNSKLDRMNAILAKLLPEYAAAMEVNLSEDASKKNSNEADILNNPISATISTESSNQNEVIYYLHGFTDDQIAEGINLAEQMLKEQGMDVSKNEFFINIKSKSGYKDEFIKQIRTSVLKELDETYQRDIDAGHTVVKLY